MEFLNKYHADNYKVYNLCTRAQDQYDPEKFGGNVVRRSRRQRTREPLPPPHRPRVGVLRARRRPFRLLTTGCRR